LTPFSAAPRGLVRLAAAAFCCLAVFLSLSAPLAAQEASITVDAKAPAQPVNPLLLGQNILFASNTLWNTRVKDIDPAVAPLVKRLAPTLLRFPGGSVSDQYLWEDGVGMRTTQPVKPLAANIPLSAAPQWQTVRKARFVDGIGGGMGDPFMFLRLAGDRLEGILDLKNAHPAGAVVRPEPRASQPDYFINNYGMMEHMKLCRLLGADAVITVNYSTGLDKEGRLSTQASLSQRAKRAAAWVAFLNGAAANAQTLGVDDEGNDWRTVGHWAKLRADMGHPEPFKVRWWEVGNETYDRHEVGFTTAQRYGQEFVRFAEAMKAVDPSIKVGAVGMTFPRGKGDADQVDPWNPTVVRLGRAQMDFFIVHPYYPGAGQSKVTYQSPAWFTAVLGGANQAVDDLREIRKVIDSEAAGRKIDLALTEYGIWPADSKDARDYSNLGRTVFEADLLLGLLKQGSSLGVNMAVAWNLHGSNPTAALGYYWKTGTRRVRRPRLGGQVMATQVTAPGFAVPQVGNVRAAANVPLLNAAAISRGPGQGLTLLVVNRSFNASTPVAIRLQNFTPAPEARVITLTSDKVGDHNEERETTVAPKESRITVAGPQFSYTFAPHSFTIMEFGPATH
jgi:alpha-L-arabinofuranosidase